MRFYNLPHLPAPSSTSHMFSVAKPQHETYPGHLFFLKLPPETDKFPNMCMNRLIPRGSASSLVQIAKHEKRIQNKESNNKGPNRDDCLKPCQRKKTISNVESTCHTRHETGRRSCMSRLSSKKKKTTDKNMAARKLKADTDKRVRRYPER